MTRKPINTSASSRNLDSAQGNFKVTLTSRAFPKFGVRAVTRSYRFGAETGAFSLESLTDAAARAESDTALPRLEIDPADIHDARTCCIYADHFLQSAMADSPFALGLEQRAREIAVTAGAREAETIEDIILKWVLVANWMGSTHLAHAQAVAGYLTQMIARDCASLGFDFALLREEAAKLMPILTS